MLECTAEIILTLLEIIIIPKCVLPFSLNIESRYKPIHTAKCLREGRNSEHHLKELNWFGTP